MGIFAGLTEYRDLGCIYINTEHFKRIFFSTFWSFVHVEMAKSELFEDLVSQVDTFENTFWRRTLVVTHVVLVYIRGCTGIVVPSVHFNSVAEDKCYFVQSSYCIRAKMVVIECIQINVDVVLD